MDNKQIRLSVIVPVYNEVATIGEILRKVRAQKINGVAIEIVVVDDGSKDGTRDFLDGNPHLYDIFLKNPKNLGKGGAVKNALAKATGDYVLFQDADLEYDPDEYESLLFPVLKFGADIVIGSRLTGVKWTRVYYFWHKIGNTFITTWFNIFYSTTWTDIYSCYLLYRRNLVLASDLRTTGWQQHAEILSKACLRGKKFYEVPVSYNGRTYEEGKKIHWYHVVNVLLTIFRFRFLS